MNLNRSGITSTDYVSEKQILFCKEGYIGVSVVVGNTGVTAADGKKIIKAGTPLAGDLTARGTAFKKATTTTGSDGAADTSDAVGVAYRDIDVTDGNANATLMVKGCVNLDALDSTVVTLVDDAVKAALKGNILFLK